MSIIKRLSLVRQLNIAEKLLHMIVDSKTTFSSSAAAARIKAYQYGQQTKNKRSSNT